MKPLSHNYRRFPQNPFLKERLVRANPEDEKREQEGPQGERLNRREEELVRSLREMVKAPKDYSDRGEIEAGWNVLLGQYESLKRRQHWVEEQKKLLESPNPTIKDENGKDVPFDLRESVWSNRVKKLYGAFEQAREDDVSPAGSKDPAHVKNLSFQVAYEKLFQDQLKGEIIPQIIRDCDDVIGQLEGDKHTIEEEIKNRQQEDFLHRLDWLKQQWEEHPPKLGDDPQTKAALANRFELIAKAREQVQRLPANATLEDLKKLWNGIRSLEMLYDQEKNISDTAQNMSPEKIRRHLAAVKEVEKAQIEAKAEIFRKEREETVRGVNTST